MAIKRRRRRKGFTLMELVMSVAILGIVASIAIPGYNRSICKARQADGKRVLANFRKDMLACMTTVSNKAESDACVTSAKNQAVTLNPYYDFTIVNYTAFLKATDPSTEVVVSFEITGNSRTPLMPGATTDQIYAASRTQPQVWVDSCTMAMPGSSSSTGGGGTTSSSGSTSGSSSGSSSSSGCGCGCGCGAASQTYTAADQVSAMK